MSFFRVIILCAMTALFIAACTSNVPPDRPAAPGDGGGAGGSGGAGGGVGGAGAGTPPLPPIVTPDAGGGGTGVPGKGIIVADIPSPLTVSGRPAAVRFQLVLESGPAMMKVIWSVDDTRIGSIGSDDGGFQANGQVGGLVTVTAMLGNSKFTAQYAVNVDITENPAGLSPADQTVLRAGSTGPTDASFRWLYPYDRTVFPRGLAAPVLQFSGAAPNATYLAIKLPFYSYQQFAAGSSPIRATIPEAVWRGITLTAGPADAVEVSLTKRSGSDVTGPIAESWFIAPASLKGIVYYNTYKSPLTSNGGIMRIRAGQNAEVVQAGCTVCHSVSANGSVLAAGLNYSLADYSPSDSATYDLSPTGTLTVRTQSPEGRLFSFAALTPDGSKALVNGLPPNRWPPFIARGIFAPQGVSSRLIDTKTGQEIAAPSLAAHTTYAQTPAFSPSGARVAFINGDRLERRVLSVLDFDGAASPPVFSNLRDVVDQTNKAVAWPTFLPDGEVIVYHEGDSYDSYIFSENNAPSLPQYAEIRLVSLADKRIKSLNALNGRTPTGQTYLPYGDSVEGQMNYEPSALPVAVGGYYWVLLTSRRAFGNTIAPGGTLPRGGDPWGNEADPSPRKKIWIAAIDIDHASKDDPSHPAFYLPGQELEAGNMRAFAALAPCKPNGQSCESGADCCNGFCRETGRAPDGTPILQCVPPPPNTCSNTDELCTTAADCCDPRSICVNNRCTTRIVK
jgi:hypothetical protein